MTAPAIKVTTAVVITATSVAGPNVTSAANLSIVCAAVFAVTACNPVGVLPCTLLNGSNAVPYTQSISFVGGVSPYTYSVPVVSLPNCLKLNTSSTSTTST